ncbi:MAG: YafY family transcriptional regulator [Proteobacteria bacterium]|nr:YafY family transcriptional regulator [Pseudomonadota bacterium]
MRRADRLFQIIQILRRTKIVTAARLAEELEVSERTIYRDITDLLSSGVQIQGEAGVGYTLSSLYDFPPLMFSDEEVEALVVGARIVKKWADPKLANAAEDVLVKVETVLPERLKSKIQKLPIFSLNFKYSEKDMDHLRLLRWATNNYTKVKIVYEKNPGDKTERVIRPLCLAFTPPYWLISTWCELRQDFRNFRLDRITNIEDMKENFVEEPGRSLEDFLAHVGAKS